MLTSCILIYFKVNAKEPQAISVPILMYHSVLKSKSGKFPGFKS